ncbi:MAG: RNA polymerase factor sigma-54 [Eubacterium sp.]|nr:RNA polymerase factor sigma-54 [Eubacterium sp.]
MNISMTLAQKQVLTQQMVQTMNILQMNAQELEHYINDMALENPTIEVEAYSSHEEGDAARQADLERKLAWLETTDRQNSVYYRSDDDPDNREANLLDIRDRGESLADFIRSQVMHRQFSDRQQRILDYLIEALDQDGYFTDDPAATAEFLQVTPEEFEEMLNQLKKLEPAGIGARNLPECLALQLARQDEDPEILRDAEIIAREYLPLIAKNHLSVIAKKMKMSAERVGVCCSLIRSLNPKPGNSFNDREHFHYITPDVVVVKFDDRFEVLVNERQYPSFRINAYYENMEKTTSDKEAKAYLRDKLKQTRELQDSIRYRMSTLSGVAHILVEKQLEFFLHGPGHRQPLQLSDFAEELDLHVSTVSRALSNKYLQCSWGIYPLNYFLTAEVRGKSSGESSTQEQILRKLEEIVAAEDKAKPLSDQAIAEKLKEFGMEISRRTVSKYRSICGIPDKSGRRQ